MEKVLRGSSVRILIVSQYFMPETFIINDLALEIEKLGHEVTVLTGKPNYPEGKIFTGYRAKGFQSERYGQNISILRVPMRPRGPGGAKNLILNYLSFVISGCLFGPWLLRGRQFDVILVFGVSPITAVIPAILLKVIKRASLSVWVQDLWPQSLVVTNYIRNPYLLKMVEWMVWAIYKCSDQILVQSRSFVAPIKHIFSKAEPIYYPNSFRRMPENLQGPKPTSLAEVFAGEFNLVFAGNIGKAQSVETIVAAAKILRDDPKIKIVFIGSGSMLSWIEEQKRQFSLNNIICAGRFDFSFMPSIYAQADAFLLTLNADDILQYTLPWKTQGYLAAGKPIVGAIDGEGARVIVEAGCGYCGPAENAEVLAENIKKMAVLSGAERRKMGESGKEYFEENFEMLGQVKRLVDILENSVQ